MEMKPLAPCRNSNYDKGDDDGGGSDDGDNDGQKWQDREERVKVGKWKNNNGYILP